MMKQLQIKEEHIRSLTEVKTVSFKPGGVSLLLFFSR